MKLEPIIHLFLNSNVFFLFYLKSSRKVLHFFWMKYLFWVILNFLLIRIVFSFSSHSLLLLFLFIWLKFLGSFLKYQVVIVSCHSYVQGAKKLMGELSACMQNYCGWVSFILCWSDICVAISLGNHEKSVFIGLFSSI